MRTLQEIERILKEHIDEIRKEFKVKELSIFGSFARGEAGKCSDVDILVDFYEVPDFLEFLRLEIYLEEIIGVKVDLVRKDAIREEIKDEVLKEAVPV